MKFTAMGGFGEHGRNCFLTELSDGNGRRIRIMTDCGVMEGKESAEPKFRPDTAASADYVFITHSHKDHSGALDRLTELGLTAPVYMTGETRRQLATECRTIVVFDEKEDSGEAQGQKKTFCPEPGLLVTWGRSGHCAGSVWLHISTGKEAVFFSGDYQEPAPVYEADPVRNLRADLAVVDAALGDEEREAEERREAIMEFISDQLEKGRPVLLPVPRYGRGIELFAIISLKMPGVPVYAGHKFINEIRRMADSAFWVKEEARDEFQKALEGKRAAKDCKEPFIRIVTDPQLKQVKHQKMAKQFLSDGGAVLITGEVKEGSFLKMLQDRKQAVYLPYSHHHTMREAERLCGQNQFGTVIFNHNLEQNIMVNG